MTSAVGSLECIILIKRTPSLEAALLPGAGVRGQNLDGDRSTFSSRLILKLLIDTPGILGLSYGIMVSRNPHACGETLSTGEVIN